MRTGYRLALGAAAVTLVLAIVLLVVELIEPARDPNADGQVSVPGRESVSLPAGDVIIFYGDRLEGAGAALPLPSLRLRVRTPSGQFLVDLAPQFSTQFENGGRAWRSMAKLRVPEPGSYEAITPSRVASAEDPVIGFGHQGSRNFGYVLFVLSGGLLLAAILGGGTALVARREAAQRGGRENRV